MEEENRLEGLANSFADIENEIEDWRRVIKKNPPARSESEAKDEILTSLSRAQTQLAKAIQAARGEEVHR